MIMNKRSKGNALLVVLIITAAVASIMTVISTSMISHVRTVAGYESCVRSFYLAEAGIEEAKSILASNPYWFTDAPHTPANDANWLMNSAAGSTKQMNGGTYKIVKESGKNTIYSVGATRYGKCILNIKYGTGPFTAYELKVI
jgi:Tfp pilus assembly protein PilX